MEAGLGGGRSLLQVRGGHKERGREREKQRRTQERAETYPPVEFKVESQIPEQDFDSASLNHFIFVIVIIYSFELFFPKGCFLFHCKSHQQQTVAEQNQNFQVMNEVNALTLTRCWICNKNPEYSQTNLKLGSAAHRVALTSKMLWQKIQMPL